MNVNAKAQNIEIVFVAASFLDKIQGRQKSRIREYLFSNIRKCSFTPTHLSLDPGFNYSKVEAILERSYI